MSTNEFVSGAGTGGDESSFTGNHVYHSIDYSATDFKSLEFEITGDIDFAPAYYPERVTVGKERDIVREKSICMGEYINDVGTKNREIHVVGKILTPELREFHDLVELGESFDLFIMQWAGEVMLEDSELEGPVGVDVHTKHFMYEYTLDFVSTGRDELNQISDGILDGSAQVNDLDGNTDDDTIVSGDGSETTTFSS